MKNSSKPMLSEVRKTAIALQQGLSDLPQEAVGDLKPQFVTLSFDIIRLLNQAAEAGTPRQYFGFLNQAYAKSLDLNRKLNGLKSLEQGLMPKAVLDKSSELVSMLSRLLSSTHIGYRLGRDKLTNSEQ